MDILRDDKRDLKACSLTCKAMFASTRHLIHQTLYLTRTNSEMILTSEEKSRYHPGGPVGELGQLRFLSFMGERDLLKYARHVYIRAEFISSSGFLGPYLQHLQSLDRIHTLTLCSYHAIQRHNIHDTCFTQFYSTLTTLALYSPASYAYRAMLQFALQFPNLENLTLVSRPQRQVLSVTATPPIFTQSPPLRGHFRCVGVNPKVPGWLKEFAFDLPNGVSFRSIEFQDVHRENGQHILDGCASSLEEFTLTIRTVNYSEDELLPHSIRTTKTEHIDSHLQKPSNWATSTSGKTGHSDPSYSAPRFSTCPNYRWYPAG